MATNFPTSVDNFTNPTANDSLNLPSHSTQHANANDAIEAIENAIIDPANYPDQLVNKTTATVSPLPFAISAGTATLNFSASSAATLAVTFAASRFTQSPLIQVTGATNTALSRGSIYQVIGVTSSGFTVYATYAAGGSQTGTVTGHWQAVQMTSAAAAG